MTRGLVCGIVELLHQTQHQKPEPSFPAVRDEHRGWLDEAVVNKVNVATLRLLHSRLDELLHQV
eukprot:1152550-Prorocentrum_minimum.AAC.1